MTHITKTGKHKTSTIRKILLATLYLASTGLVKAPIVCRIAGLLYLYLRLNFQEWLATLGISIGLTATFLNHLWSYKKLSITSFYMRTWISLTISKMITRSLKLNNKSLELCAFVAIDKLFCVLFFADVTPLKYLGYSAPVLLQAILYTSFLATYFNLNSREK